VVIGTDKKPLLITVNHHVIDESEMDTRIIIDHKRPYVI